MRGKRRQEAKVVLALVVVDQTERAYKVDLDCMFQTWVPKSQVTIPSAGKMVLPRWLAIEKGLL